MSLPRTTACARRVESAKPLDGRVTILVDLALDPRAPFGLDRRRDIEVGEGRTEVEAGAARHDRDAARG